MLKWPVSARLAVDGNVQTGWSVYGRIGERHTAVFVLEQPIEQARSLEIAMTFGRHFASSLGRFRISVTTAPSPEAVDLPEDVERLLTKPDLCEAELASLRLEFLLSAPELRKHALEIRRLRKPDPYKQKGVRYTGEQLKKKAGKTGAK